MDQNVSYYCGIAIFCLALVLATGCTTPGGQVTPTPTITPTPIPTPAPVDLRTFGAIDNGAIYTVPLDAEVTLHLAENPSTGYVWTLALTDGLVLINDSYVPNATTLVGSGGIHTWNLKTVMPGMQKISGTYARPQDSTLAAAYYELTLLVHGPCGNDTCPPSPVPPRFHVYTFEDNGKLVNESLGEQFNVRLAENPTTGYSWNFSVSDGLRVVKDEFIPSVPDGQIVGAGGVRSVMVETLMTGEQTIHGEYRRPWVAAGTVTYVDLEVGFYGIVADDGTKYLPLNMDGKFRVNNLRVAFDREIVKNVSTIQQWGTPVNLTLIEGIQEYTIRIMVA